MIHEEHCGCCNSDCDDCSCTCSFEWFEGQVDTELLKKIQKHGSLADPHEEAE